MRFMKSAAVAAIVASAALGASMTAANAGKKMHLHGFGPHHHHYKPHFHGGGLIILSTSVSPCQKWWHRYLRTGNKVYLHTYRVCMR